MSDRETRTLTIGQYSFSVKTYATAREVNAIQRVYFRGTKVDVVGQEPRIQEFNPDVQFEVQKEMPSRSFSRKPTLVARRTPAS